MTFRPYPGLTIACAILFALLCGLGTWQLERLQWKLALIARVNEKIHSRPIPVDGDGGVLEWEPFNEYQRVSLQGRFDHSKEAYVFTTGEEGAAVYHVLTPFITGAGHWFIVDRGEVPKDKLDPKTRRDGQVAGETQLVGIWRTPDPPGAFTPAPDVVHRIWYARDLASIAAADGLNLGQRSVNTLTLAAPVVIEADASPNPGGWPRGGQTVVSFRNQHLSYAVTWFGLAIVLLGVWFSYHISKGRIAWN